MTVLKLQLEQTQTMLSDTESVLKTNRGQIQDLTLEIQSLNGDFKSVG